jgi:hypothetical protein
MSRISFPAGSPEAALLAICIVGMDACWTYSVAWLFSQVVLSEVINFPVPSAFVLGLLELGGWALMVYLLDRTALSTGTIRILVAAMGLVLSGAIALALNPFDPARYSFIWLLVFLYAGFVSLGLWLLGAFRATQRSVFEDVYSNFRLGLVAMSLAALLSTLLANQQINQLWTELGGVGLWFFVFGLAGLALANREAVRRETGNAGMKSWGWLAAASVAGILLLGSVGRAFGGKDALSALWDVMVGILAVFAVILYGIVYVILLPFTLFDIRVGPTGVAPPTPTPVPVAKPNPLEQFQKHPVSAFPFQIPTELQTLFMTLAALLVAAGVVYLMVRWLRRTNTNRVQIESEERTNFGSWTLLIAQARAWLQSLLARFRKPAPAAAGAGEDDLAALLAYPELAGTLSVRQIYARLLKLAGSAGYPRASYQTPLEYQRFLSTALPTLRSELSDITAAYLEARYAPLPPSAPTVQAATVAWRRAEPVLAGEIESRKSLL